MGHAVPRPPGLQRVHGAQRKGRSPSKSLNRVLLQTNAIILAGNLDPKCEHVPTWSLRADEPSRGYVLRGPRMALPWWFRLLVAGHARLARALLDEKEGARQGG